MNSIFTLEKILTQVDEIPLLPQISYKVMEAINNENSSVMDVANIISTDQGLTAKILRLCNSAFYGLSRKVSTVSEAVSIVGFSTIKSMLMIVTTLDMIKKDLIGYGIKSDEFWKHSLYTAQSSYYLSIELDYRDEEEAFIGGLLHDIGKIVLNNYALPGLYQVRNLVYNNGYNLFEAEKMIFGFDHAKIGGKLAERWNFPEVLVNAIDKHHFPENLLEDEIFPIIVGLGDYFANNIKENNENLFIPEKILKLTNISIKEINEIYKNRKDNIIETVSQLMVF